MRAHFSFGLLARALAPFAFSATAWGLCYEGNVVSQTFRRMPVTPDKEIRITLETKIFAVSQFPEWVEVPIYDCEDQAAPKPAPGDWFGFFEATEPDDQASRLAVAIQGIDYGLARELVADRVFLKKPDSWRDFERLVTAADRRHQTGFSYQVLVTYKRENIRRLDLLASADCTYQILPERRLVQSRDVSRRTKRSFVVRMKAPVLRRGEEEKPILLYDGFTDGLVLPTDYHEFTVRRTTPEENSVEYEIEGKRKQVPPNNTLSVELHVEGGKLSLLVDDSDYEPEVDAGSIKKIRGTVELVHSGWRKNRVLATFERPLAEKSQALTDLEVSVPKGAKIAVKYTLQFSASPYFSEEPSYQKSTLASF